MHMQLLEHANPCDTCVNYDDLSECIKCNNGSAYMADVEPIACSGCGHYMSFIGTCPICHYDNKNMTTTTAHDDYCDNSGRTSN